MHIDILPLLCDPLDGSQLMLQNETIKNGEVESGMLISDSGREYPIINGIPRFTGKNETAKEAMTRASFEKEWAHFHRFDGFMGSSELLRSFIHPLGENDFQGKNVVECGCGAGRWLKVAAQWKAKYVIGVDFSSSVEISKRLCEGIPNIDILQASIFNLPLKKNVFDVVYSIGVLHHLRDPQEGLKNICGLARPGGKIAAWVYSLEGSRLYLALTWPLRKLGPLLGHTPMLMLSYGLGIVLRIFILAVNPLLRKMRIKIPLSDYMDNILKKLTYQSLCSVIYDQLTPAIAHYYSLEELKRMIASLSPALKECGLSLREGNGWRIALEKTC